MRFSTLVSSTALAAGFATAHNSSLSDTDTAIWDNVNDLHVRSEMQERLAKRQTTWNPPSNLVTPLKQVWDHEMSTYSNPLGFKNYGYDQLIANKG